MGNKSRISILFIGVLGLCSVSSFAKDVSHFNGSVSFMIPDTYVALSKEQILAKYNRGGAGTPTVVYSKTSDRQSITFALGQRSDLKMNTLNHTAIPAFKKSINSSGSVLTWHSALMRNLGGKQVLVLDFETTAAESDNYKIRNTMAFYYGGGKFSSATVNCTTDNSIECAEVKAMFLKSLRFK